MSEIPALTRHSRDFDATIDHFATRLDAEVTPLSAAWLERLDSLLDVDRREVFPTHQLLDHIPDLLREIARYLRAPEDQEIAANTTVMAKAAELGLLRFDQQGSVHQLLREYQFLAEILEAFFAREAAALGDQADAAGALLALARTQQAVRELQRRTVDAFIARYTETIDRQHAQLRGFGRLVSHEIRQPLGVLQVLARLLQATEDAARRQLVETLERNVVRLGEVAGKLERLAGLTRRTESAPNDQAVDLGAVCRDVAAQLADMAEVRGVIFDIEPEMPFLTADAGRIELVLINLFANAIKYSDPVKDPRFVRVRCNTDGPEPRLQIEDNGIGIPPAKLALIFEQFVRIHAHLDEELGAQGLGLGLSIVRECMEAMDGTVTVESRDGEGSTFLLAWPASAWQTQEDTAAPAPDIDA